MATNSQVTSHKKRTNLSIDSQLLFEAKLLVLMFRKLQKPGLHKLLNCKNSSAGLKIINKRLKAQMILLLSMAYRLQSTGISNGSLRCLSNQ